MSLTSLVEQPDVRERFKAEFKKPLLQLESTVYVAPVNPTHASLVGTAFDYLLRLHVTLSNDGVWTRPWIAEEALEKLTFRAAAGMPLFPPGVAGNPRSLVRRAKAMFANAQAQHDRCCDTGRIHDSMLQSCLHLAQLDTFYRCGLVSATFGEVSSGDVQDLRNLLDLASSVAPSPFANASFCLLNPSFNEASSLVGGADADLLLDDTLFEIKTTKRLALTAETFRQLLGYVVLHKIAGVTRGSRRKVEIKHIAVYLSRFGVIAKMPLAGIVNPATFPAFVQWFKKRAENGPPDGVARRERFFVSDSASTP